MTKMTNAPKKECRRAAPRLTTADVNEFYRELRMATALAVLRDRQPGVSIAETWSFYRPFVAEEN